MQIMINNILVNKIKCYCILFKLIEPFFFFSIILKTAGRKGLLNQDLDLGLNFFLFSNYCPSLRTPQCNSEVIMKWEKVFQVSQQHWLFNRPLATAKTLV